MTLEELRIVARSLAESDTKIEDIEAVARKEVAMRLIMREIKLKTLDPRLSEDTDVRLRS